jgi:N-acetylglutamate synthase-like GNAT family acetyltransferase
MIRIVVVDFNSKEYLKCLDLRLKVLRLPLGMVSFTQKELDMDVDSTHIAAFSNEQILGNLILTRKDSDVIKMRQVCVDQEFQGQNIGQKMVAFAEE